MRPGELPKAKWLDQNTRSEIAASAGPLSLEKQHPQAASEGATAFFAILGTIRQSGLAGVLIHRSSVIPLALRDVKDRPQSAQWLLFRNLIV